MRVVLLGAPGSGKGTQGPLLAGRLGVPYLSTGDLLREQVAQGSDIGRQVGPYLDRGELVPDDLALAALGDALAAADRAGGFVLDGFPRTVAQAERAEDLIRPDAVVYLAVPDDVARQRLRRRASRGRSDDADAEVIEQRLRLFHRQTEPLLQRYRDRGLLHAVDGSQPPADTAAALLHELADLGDPSTDRDP